METLFGFKITDSESIPTIELYRVCYLCWSSVERRGVIENGSNCGWMKMSKLTVNTLPLFVFHEQLTQRKTHTIDTHVGNEQILYGHSLQPL